MLVADAISACFFSGTQISTAPCPRLLAGVHCSCKRTLLRWLGVAVSLQSIFCNNNIDQD